MNTYHLKIKSDNRVYLCPIPPTKDEELIDSIAAKTWQEARSFVADFSYQRRPGYGFFA